MHKLTLRNVYYTCYFYIIAIVNPKATPGSKDAVKSFNYDYSYFSMDVSVSVFHFNEKY